MTVSNVNTASWRAETMSDLVGLARRIAEQTETCDCPDNPHQNAMHDLAHDLERLAPLGAPLADMLTDYLDARGIPMPDITTGSKVREESAELAEALSGGDAAAIRHEIADVVLAATVVADQVGVSVEDCIREKTTHDEGRG